ncbi:hypothetical protein [Mesorhizobium sp.]|uniref:hypothetical protein n=1 Tax=Mesorhizobium sp. TaxID=1871066 RepID=UPI00120B84B6|nr:hypothetical protein [Mesorhizobium sp.]TIO07556.1 MAG: hypothetical protein E5X88_17835 [Mesorhizobium sp.]TIO31920.1 MAG: hypothetical protein E5X89_21415 [Mesorhizobium sp.]TIP10228.1 MAG: hypothetical protein E5X73_23020 [Mesorhizobium sp.]
MKTHALILAATGASLIAFTGLAKADDHLFDALQHGLSPDSQPLQTNKAGHSGDVAPGQGSPFTGHDMQTPATDTEAANDHANVKAREPK